MTVHDFNYVCPRKWMIDPAGRPCARGLGAACLVLDCHSGKRGRRHLPYHGLRWLKIQLHRALLRRLVDVFVAPSEALASWLRRELGGRAREDRAHPQLRLRAAGAAAATRRDPKGRAVRRTSQPREGRRLPAPGVLERSGAASRRRAWSSRATGPRGARSSSWRDGWDWCRRRRSRVCSATSFSMSATRRPAAPCSRACGSRTARWACSRRWPPARRSWPAAWAASPRSSVDGETGLLFERGDSVQLAAQLARILGDSALEARLGSAARAESARRFSPQAHRPQLLGLYERCLGAAGRRAVRE